MTGSLVADSAAIAAWHTDLHLEHVGHTVDRQGFAAGMNLMEQNAFYQPSTNTINMLAGLLLAPMFDASWPSMLNKASYGYVIGHEVR